MKHDEFLRKHLIFTGEELSKHQSFLGSYSTIRFLCSISLLLLIISISLLINGCDKPPSSPEVELPGSNDDDSPYSGCWAVDPMDPEMLQPVPISFVGEGCSGPNCAYCTEVSGETDWFRIMGAGEVLYVYHELDSLFSRPSEVTWSGPHPYVSTVTMSQSLHGTTFGDSVHFIYRYSVEVVYNPPYGQEDWAEQWEVEGVFEDATTGIPAKYVEGTVRSVTASKDVMHLDYCLTMHASYAGGPARLRIIIVPEQSTSMTCLIGRVVDGEGNPVAGAWVTAQHLQSGAPLGNAMTDEEGRYCIEVPTESMVQISASITICGRDFSSDAPQFIMTPSRVTDCDQGGCQLVDDFVIDFDALTTCVEGRVVDQDGDPIGDALVEARCTEATETISSTYTETNGTYCIEVPTSSVVLLYASKIVDDTLKLYSRHPLYVTTQADEADCGWLGCQELEDELVIELERRGGCCPGGISTGDFLGWTGSDDPEHYFTMVRIDGQTGEVSNIGGFEYFTALCYDCDGVLYGIDWGVSIIDPQTGADSLLFTFEYEGESYILMREATIGVGNVLYVHDSSGRIFTVDLATGHMNYIGDETSLWTGLEFAPNDRLYGSFSRLYELDPVDGHTLYEVGDRFDKYVSRLSSWPAPTLFGMDIFPSTTIWTIDPASAAILAALSLDSPGIACFVPELTTSTPMPIAPPATGAETIEREEKLKRLLSQEAREREWHRSLRK